MLVPGSTIGGRYTLIRQLDRGAMGEIWVARESDTRDVAMKFIAAEREDPALIERFLDEIRTAARLRSAHLVGVYHWGIHLGSPYMVMELLKGSNLAERLRVRGVEDARLVVDYVVQACDALVVAHAEGVIHRDLKPANLFLDEQTRQIKVLDFGVAKVAQAIRTTLTKDGSHLGTLAYISPEQLASPSDVTPRSDIWSMGAVLYELLSGKRAFPQPYPSIVSAIQERAPRSLLETCPEVPEGLASCVMRCLAKRPAERFPDAAALIHALAEFGGRESQLIASRLPEATSPSSVRSAPSEDASPEFHSEEDLVQAVCAVRPTSNGSPRQVVFMLGAGFSMPTRKQKGVPDTNGIVALLSQQLTGAHRKQLQEVLRVSANKYQDAFDLLASRHTADVANTVIRHAVLHAHSGSRQLPEGPREQESRCLTYEFATEEWSVPEGVDHLGRIVARGQMASSAGSTSAYERFSHLHLTTNFDPLLAISIRRQGGACVPFAVAQDFLIPKPPPKNCFIVHLHGRWSEGDTLHNNLDLRREQLERSLAETLERSVLVVLGYGGWDDVFTRTLKEVARRANAVDVLWGFFSNDPREIWQQQHKLIQPLQRLGPRIQFYRGVDTNRFFKLLASRLAEQDSESGTARPVVVAGASWRKSRLRFLPIAALVSGLALAVLGLRYLLPDAAPEQAAVSSAVGAVQPVSSVTPALEVPPKVAPPPVAPHLEVECDLPLPHRSVRIGSESIPDFEFCPPDASAAARELRFSALTEKYPGLRTASSVTIEPEHPFYSVQVDRDPEHIVFRLKMRETAPVTLRLEGIDCANLTQVSLRVENRVVADLSSSAGPLRQTGGPSGASGVCERQILLPFMAFGKKVSFVVEPKEYLATGVPFTGATIVTAVTSAPRKVSPRGNIAGKGPPEREPEQVPAPRKCPPDCWL